MIDYRVEDRVRVDLIGAQDEFYLEYTGEKREERGLGPVYVQPPLLVSNGRQYSLVTGREAVQHCREKQEPLPYAVVVDSIEDRKALMQFLILMKSQLWGFNVVEKAVAVKRLYDLSSTVNGDLLKLLGIPKSERFIRGYIALADAPDIVKGLVLTGRVDLLTAFELFSFEKRYWSRLAHFIAGIRLGTKKSNRLLTMLYDIIHRDGMTVEQLIGSCEIEEILNSKIDAKHKGQKVYESIERIRNPYMTEYKERFYDAVRKVGIDPQLHLTIPQDFEEWKFRISFSFTSVEDFRKKAQLLIKIGSETTFHELMDLRY